jgi:hypothetical protein
MGMDTPRPIGDRSLGRVQTHADRKEGTAMDLPDPISSPDLLDFLVTVQTWDRLSEDDRRDLIVKTLEQTVNFGVSDTPPGRHQAYGDIIASGETAQRRSEMLQKNSQQSSCGYLVRSIWRFLGCKDPLVDPPNVPGKVITNLIAYAKANDAHATPTTDNFNPKKGDVLYIQGTDAKGYHQHIFTITEVCDDGVTFNSIDGGQPQPHLIVDDGGCNGIQRRTRKLNKETLTFEGDFKKITDWIDVTKLPFSEPIMELTRNLKDEDVHK